MSENVMAAVVTIHISNSSKNLTAETTSDRLKRHLKIILKFYSSLPESGFYTFALPPIVLNIIFQIPTPRKPPFFQEQIHDLNLISIQGGASNAES